MTSSERDAAADQPPAHPGADPAVPEDGTGVLTLPPPPAEDTVVVPADEDPVAAAGSEVLGGAPGRRALLGVSWWTAGRVLAVCTIIVFALGMVQKVPCYNSGWFFGTTAQYDHACYSDIPHMFSLRGFSIGSVPYLDRIPGASDPANAHMQYLEYPVLTGLFMWFAAWLTPSGSDVHREQVYWLLNSGMLMICAVVAVIAVMRTHRRRPWDAMLFALAPVLALDSTVNWDLLTVALTALALACWANRRVVWAGALLGLAVSAKFYPLLLLLPLLLLCWRAGRMRAFGQALGAGIGAWLVLNVPFMLLNFSGWATFWTYNASRKVDYGSFWLILSQNGVTSWSTTTVNVVILLLMALCGLGVAWLALGARRRPRLAQLAFLMIAAFVLTNKVYSPQYVLWLVPLAVLARPRWRDFLVWQACEVLYFLAIWFYFAYSTSPHQKGLPADWYHAAIVVHLLGLLYLCVMVIRDVLAPECDVVRWDGSDDPSGGVLDRADDAFASVDEEFGDAKYADSAAG
ncbi:glycosyltransferase family 87 protein [Streptacidiphilus sp. PAMC 29251]